MNAKFNYRPENWKKIELKDFTSFLLHYPFVHEYRQIFIDEDDVKKGVTPTMLFYLPDKSYGVAIVRNHIDNEEDTFFSFGNGKKEWDDSNIAYL